MTHKIVPMCAVLALVGCAAAPKPVPQTPPPHESVGTAAPVDLHDNPALGCGHDLPCYKHKAHHVHYWIDSHGHKHVVKHPVHKPAQHT